MKLRIGLDCPMRGGNERDAKELGQRQPRAEYWRELLAFLRAESPMWVDSVAKLRGMNFRKWTTRRNRIREFATDRWGWF
jgi:hypothetical protein